MLRRAVVQKLKTLTALKGAYQAFLAPADASKPYATVKLSDLIGDPGIKYAGAQQVEVRIYDVLDSFIALDTIEGAIVAALNGRNITDSVTGHEFHMEYSPGGGDFVDEEKELIGRLVRFEAALVREPQ